VASCACCAIGLRLLAQSGCAPRACSSAAAPLSGDDVEALHGKRHLVHLRAIGSRLLQSPASADARAGLWLPAARSARRPAPDLPCWQSPSCCHPCWSNPAPTTPVRVTQTNLIAVDAHLTVCSPLRYRHGAATERRLGLMKIIEQNRMQNPASHRPGRGQARPKGG
jgi:hypothetical protein